MKLNKTMSEGEFYDSLDEDNYEDLPPQNNNEELQVPVKCSGIKNTSNISQGKIDSKSSVNFSIYLAYTNSACNNISRRQKKKKKSRIPILLGRSVHKMHSVLATEYDRNHRINEWLKDVEYERYMRDEEAKTQKATEGDLHDCMKNMKIGNVSNDNGIRTSRTFLSLPYQKSMETNSLREKRINISTWIPRERPKISYLSQYRQNKYRYLKTNSLKTKTYENEKERANFQDDIKKATEKNFQKGLENGYDRTSNALESDKYHIIMNSEAVGSVLFTKSTQKEDNSGQHPSLTGSKDTRNGNKFVPYSIEDYRRLPVPRLGTLGPDLEACREKLKRVERQRAYGQRVSNMNRQKVVLQLKRESLLRDKISPSPDSVTPIQNGREETSMKASHKKTTSSRFPQLRLTQSKEMQQQGNATASSVAGSRRVQGAAAASSGGVAAAPPGGSRRGLRSRARPGRPPPAPRRRRPPTASQGEVARVLKGMLERHRREVEEKQAIRRQMDTPLPCPQFSRAPGSRKPPSISSSRSSPSSRPPDPHASPPRTTSVDSDALAYSTAKTKQQERLRTSQSPSNKPRALSSSPPVDPIPQNTNKVIDTQDSLDRPTSETVLFSEEDHDLQTSGSAAGRRTPARMRTYVADDHCPPPPPPPPPLLSAGIARGSLLSVPPSPSSQKDSTLPSSLSSSPCDCGGSPSLPTSPNSHGLEC